MDEVQVSALSAELDRLHDEHHRYAQQLEELLQKPYLSEDEQIEEIRRGDANAADRIRASCSPYNR